MVKNSTGGNKSKGFARKNLVKRDTALRVAREDGEIYAQAVKVLGGSIASAIDIDGKPLRAHIRGKFRGRGKRDNFIGSGTWLLVGVHDWASEKTKPGDIIDCDILEVYNDTDKNRLKAEGNLQYPEFIELVRLLWENSYPDIPLVPTYGGKFAQYPCIAYGLELKRAHNKEPKML